MSKECCHVCTLVSISDWLLFVVVSGMPGMTLQHIISDSAVNGKNTNMLRLRVFQAFSGFIFIKVKEWLCFRFYISSVATTSHTV